MSLRLGETVIAGSVDLTTIKQAIYDGIFPVNNVQFGFTAPGVPAGVNATWSELNVLDNRFPMVLSTSAVKTLLDEELPNISGIIGFYYGTEEQCTGVFKGSYHGTEWIKLQPTTEYGSNNRIDFYANKGQVDTTKTSGYRSQAESVYKDNGVVRPKTFTVKHWKRTA